MKKVSLLFMFMMIAAVSFGQVFTGLNWVNWEENEPDYAATPYDNPQVSISEMSFDAIVDVQTFDDAWTGISEVYDIANPTDIRGGDPYDLGSGDTYYAQWKAYHNGGKMYLLLMYVDLDSQADAGSRNFEVVAQPTAYNAEAGVFRHGPTFEQGVGDGDVATQNAAYCRYVELGGGKAVFGLDEGGNPVVSEYKASLSTGNWGDNVDGKFAFDALEGEMFWDETAGVIRAVLPIDFGSATSVLSYPIDPTDPVSDRSFVELGDVFAFDVKINALIGGTADENKVQYFWSADANNGYASNYYSGHVTLTSGTSISDVGAGDVKEEVYFSNNVVYVKGQAADLEVFNLTGSKVLSAENVTSLSLSNLINGVYIVRVNGQSSVKVVKR